MSQELKDSCIESRGDNARQVGPVAPVLTATGHGWENLVLLRCGLPERGILRALQCGSRDRQVR